MYCHTAHGEFPCKRGLFALINNNHFFYFFHIYPFFSMFADVKCYKLPQI